MFIYAGSGELLAYLKLGLVSTYCFKNRLL